MGVRYEWADDRQIILNITLEVPWTWTEYRQMVDIILPMLQAIDHPVATVVDVTRMGTLPKDGNVMQILLEVESTMPANVFASVVVGAPYALTLFINLLMKLRPAVKRIAVFTRTMDEAHTIVYNRYRELYPDRV
jgi:hypothetical protein